MFSPRHSCPWTDCPVPWEQVNWLKFNMAKGGKKCVCEGKVSFQPNHPYIPFCDVNAGASGQQAGSEGPQDKWLGLERLDCSSPRQCQLSSTCMAPAFPTGSSLLPLPRNWVWQTCSSPQQQAQEQQCTHSSGLLFLDQTPGKPRPCCTLCSATHLSQAGPG